MSNSPYSYDRRAAWDPNICICGHPKHKGITPKPISKGDAKLIWAKRSKEMYLENKLTLTPNQCETVMLCWDMLPGHYSYASTFTAIMKHGSEAILGGQIRGRRR